MTERQQILEMIEAGQMSVEEGIRLLEAAEGSGEPSEDVSAPPSPPPSAAARPARPLIVNVLWQIVFWSGVVLLIGGALLVTAVYVWSVASGWLACGWPLFLVGLLVLIAGWWLRQARWLYVDIQEAEGNHFVIAFPLPLGLIDLALRLARPFVPKLQQMGIEEMIQAMEQELRDGHPFSVDVDEGAGGDRVHVSIG